MVRATIQTAGGGVDELAKALIRARPTTRGLTRRTGTGADFASWSHRVGRPSAFAKDA
jgi:hypothetical protein